MKSLVALLCVVAMPAVVCAQSTCFASATWDYWRGCIGDVGADGDVDAVDLAFVDDRIGTTELAADLDLDGIVTDADRAIVEGELGSSCAWPPARHAVLRLVADAHGADVWLDLPDDVPGGTYGVSGIQAWLVTEPDRSGVVIPDPDTVWLDLCGGLGGSLYDGGRIGFVFGAFPGQAWSGSVHLARIEGALGAYVLLYRPAGPPARCAEVDPDGGSRGLRFTVQVLRSTTEAVKSIRAPRPR